MLAGFPSSTSYSRRHKVSSDSANLILANTFRPGRSLEEIDEIFVQSKSILDTVAVARRLPHKPLPAFEPAKEKQIQEEDGECPTKISALHLEEMRPRTSILKE
jgi:hypothetical protein